MKVKTSELRGGALDWAVAKAIGKDFFIEGKAVLSFCPGADIPGVPYFDREYWMPSVKWSQGGPIFESNKIDTFWDSGNECWDASMDKGMFVESGPTPLIAAMRCFVASKFGDEIDVPEGLL